MSEEQDLDAIWERAREKILDEMTDFNRSLWDAANEAKPLVLDDDTLVLGIDPGKMRLGSHLTSTANGPMVRQCVEQVLGRSVDVELIEGADPEAWEREKQRRQEREKMAQQRQRRERESAGARAVWSELYEELGQLFGTSRDRRYSVERAKMFGKALVAVRDAEARAREEDSDAEALHEEQLNRNLDRIAILAEVPETVVAVEYLRVKRIKKD